MSFDDSFSNRVSIARNAIGLTQTELAKKVGVVPRQIAAYEGGEAKPRDKALKNLAAALGTTTEWLAQGIGNGPDVSNVKRTVTVVEIPVFSHVQAAHGCSSIGDGSSVMDFIPAPVSGSDKMFAVTINGNSMVSDGAYSFPDETIVTIEPDKEAKHGDFVLCSLPNVNEATFKQLIIDQGQMYLKALNPTYPVIPFDNEGVILGVAVHSQKVINTQTAWSKRFGETTVFIVDEAHRSVMIDEKSLEEIFTKVANKVFSGLTGTPLEQSNKSNKKPT